MRVFQHGHDLSTKEKREKHSISKLKGFHTMGDSRDFFFCTIASSCVVY